MASPALSASSPSLPKPAPSEAGFVPHVLAALTAGTDPHSLAKALCEIAVQQGPFCGAFVASANANVGWLNVDAAGGFQARQVLELRFLAKEIPGDPWAWVARAWRSGAAASVPDASAWPSLHKAHPDASGLVLPVPRRDGPSGVVVLWGAGAADADPAVRQIGALLGMALDRLTLEQHRRTADQEVRDAEQKYRAVLDTMEDAYYEVDLRGKPVYHNRAFSRMLGYEPSEIGAHDNRFRQTPEMASVVFKAFNAVYVSGEPRRSEEWEYLHKRGHKVKVEGTVQLVRDPHGRPVGFRGILRDVTEQRRMETTLRESESRFRALTSISSDWYWEQDTTHCINRLENRHSRSTSFQQSLLGKRIWECGLRRHGDETWESHIAVLDAHEPFRDVVIEGTTRSGQIFYISVSGEPCYDDSGHFCGYRGVTREITAQKVAEAHVQHMAMHDSLTGLANRAMFGQLLAMAIPTARRYERRFAVLYIDLDRFKLINDTLGHAAGDQLLQEVSERFSGALRASDVVARLGGDEFVVLIQEAGDPEQLQTVARKLLTATLKPFVLLGHECRVTASIGGVLFPDHGEDQHVLMKNADLAMYAAKEHGKNNFQMFSDTLSTNSLERLTLETNLRRAMERREFTLHYQAKVDLKSRRITGVEALLRWDNEVLGSVPPATFIPVAEDTGLIVPIGRWVLRTACEQGVRWQQEGLPPLQIAVNLSARQFNDEALLPELRLILAETGMAPHLLELEITEGMIIQNVEHAIGLLTAIKALGVRLAIDDFGTGYSSLGQLKNFPIDTLKVDRSFVRDLATNAEDKAITTAIIAMGKTLSLTVVAEGVETAEQQDFLREHACDEMQGFYFSRPVTPDAFATLFREGLVSPPAPP